MGISRVIIRLGLIGSGLFLATFAAVSVWTFGDFWTDEKDVPSSDMIVCLGAGVSASGNLGRFSIQRAETCARLYVHGKASKIIFTGAGPKGQPDAATLMALVARENGVPDGAILIEPKAYSTLQNAMFSMPLAPRAQSILLVTDSFHLPRSWMSFHWLGTPTLTLVPSRSHIPEQQAMPGIPMLMRETLAIWFNAVRLPIFWIASHLNVPHAVVILH